MKLHLGCGKRKINGYINIDIQPFPSVDMVADVTNLPFENNSADLIYSCSTIEHLPRKFWKKTLSHWNNILKPGGFIYISTMDFRAATIEYLMEGRSLQDLLGLLIGGGKDETDFHQMIFDEEILSQGLLEAGFQNIERYRWQDFEPFVQDYDDFSRAYLPHKDFENGRLMMLNLKGEKFGNKTWKL